MNPGVGVAPATDTGYKIDFRSMVAEDLDKAIRESLTSVSVLDKKIQQIVRESLLRAMKEVKRRYEDGQTIARYKTFHGYVESVGINPNTLRSWKLRYESREDERKMRTLIAGATPSGCYEDSWFGMTSEQRIEWVERDALQRAARAAQELKEQEEQKAELTPEAQEKEAAREKRVEEKKALEAKIATLPSLGHLSSDVKGSGYRYECATEDFKFFANANGIDEIRELTGAHCARADGYTPNPTSLMNNISDYIETAIGSAESLTEQLRQVLAVSESIRMNAKAGNLTPGISGVQTQELNEHLNQLNEVITRLKAVREPLARIVIPTLTSQETL